MDSTNRRFQRQCEFLSTLRHPDIVQYLGLGRDPDTGLPVMLLELMEENLTDYLEDLSHPVSYHVQVNICHSVASALSYLHANDIVVRDVHSGDILLARNAQVVKLSISGTSAFDISNREEVSVGPGFDVYLPPEAAVYDPKYTDKVDCFSFGVVMIHILTRECPRPGDRTKYINDPKFEFAIATPVPEIERWQDHISKVDPGHPLLPIVLECLKDKDVDRPTAHQLYERIGALKERPQYGESSSAAPEAGIPEQLQRQRQQQEEEIHRLRDEVRQNQMLIEEVFENAKHQQKLAVEIEVESEKRHRTQLEQQLLQSQAETRRIEQQYHQEQLQSSQKERELAHTRQQMTDLQQQIHIEQQRVLQSEARAREQVSRIEGQFHAHI